MKRPEKVSPRHRPRKSTRDPEMETFRKKILETNESPVSQEEDKLIKEARMRWHQPGQSQPEDCAGDPSPYDRSLSSGAYLDPHFLFNSISANIISSIVLGECFNYQDPRLLQLLHLMNEIFIILYSSYAQVRYQMHGGPAIRVGGPQEEIKYFLSWTLNREGITPAPPQVRPSVSFGGQNQALDKDGLQEKKVQQMWEWLKLVQGSMHHCLHLCVCVGVCVSVNVCVCVCMLRWEVHPPSPQGERCPLDVATCADQNINTHRTSPVNTMGSAPCLLPCRCLKSSRASWNTSLAHTPACTAWFKKWKILSLRTGRGTRRCWTPVALRTSLIPFCSSWTR